MHDKVIADVNEWLKTQPKENTRTSVEENDNQSSSNTHSSGVEGSQSAVDDSSLNDQDRNMIR